MENTVRAKVSTTWANAKTLADDIKTACTNSADEFKFTVALVGEKTIPAGGTSAVTSYGVNAKVNFNTGGFSSVQSLENSIQSACESVKKTGTEVTFKTYTGVGEN